ncbi:MAG: hypothetical protein Q9176_001819 [Flavoplaca citrina]
MFKRSRSKSDKLKTPPKIVFGDLNSAYKSIAQKTPPCTPGSHVNLHGESSGPAVVRSASSPIQSPESDASPSAALLRSRPSDTVRISHLSRDLFLPTGLDTQESKPKSAVAWDPFDTSKEHRTSFTTLEVTENLLDGYFGISQSDRAQASQQPDQSGIRAQQFSSSDYPAFKNAQSQACSVLSGAEEPLQDDSSDAYRCGIVQSVPKRHPYGRVNTNENIKSIHGLHEADQSGRLSEQDGVRQVEWSPRSSLETGAISGMSASGLQHPGAPPTGSLPQTPRNQGTVRYRLEDSSSPSKENTPSSESYGNTQRLLQISMPQLPEAPVPRNNLYHQLVTFAKEGQSSSSQGNSSMSFAEFCIEEAHGAQITRPISQGEFQQLQRTISEHRRRESHLSDETGAGSLVRVGQISFRFPDTSSEVDLGPGSSQTVSSTSEVEVNWETGSVQVPRRTRNGTPPLLFGGLNRARSDNDWETVGESNEMTSSIADVSDSVSGSPPKSFPPLRPGQVLRHPAHPRYNHSWDLQQDVRSGAFVLTPRYQQLPAGNSFPNQNALEPLSLRAGRSNYSHPTPLTMSHDNPFVTPPIRIAPNPQLTAASTQSEVQSQGTSAWLSTIGGSDAGTVSTFAGPFTKSKDLPLPPIPMKNPSRRWKQRISKDSQHQGRSLNFGFHLSKTKLDQVSAMEEAQPFTQPPQFHSEDDNNLINPFNDPVAHESIITGRESPVSNPFAPSPTFAEDIISPSHCDRRAEPEDGTLNFITAEQANYMRSKSLDWAPNNIEMQAIISPISRSRILPVPSPVSPRLWKPTPHPLAHLGPREESPHLCHLRKPSMAQKRMSHQQIVSRYYLLMCALMPVLLPPYCWGSLDWIMRMHTGGVYCEMARHEKKLAVLIFCVELLAAVAFVPLIFSLI